MEKTRTGNSIIIIIIILLLFTCIIYSNCKFQSNDILNEEQLKLTKRDTINSPAPIPSEEQINEVTVVGFIFIVIFLVVFCVGIPIILLVILYLYKQNQIKRREEERTRIYYIQD